jgi:hypothetical protein
MSDFDVNCAHIAPRLGLHPLREVGGIRVNTIHATITVEGAVLKSGGAL